jgi:hypothetical protein
MPHTAATALTLPANLRPDCSRCAGLCCVAPPFDADQGFGYDKPAHEACQHLQADFRCAIHAGLAEKGFPACASFDCFGAGQHATARHAGRTWRESNEMAVALFDDYTRLRGLHELMAMATLAIHKSGNLPECLPVKAALVELEQLGIDAGPTDIALLRHRYMPAMRAALLASQKTP